ncbi:MAG: DUF6152 family protein [Vicinamibacterales bacterium]
MRKQLVVFLGLALLSAGVRVSAHHAFAAEFDKDKPIQLKGTVTKMQWINPHPWIHIDVKKPDGTVESWMIEASAPNNLLRRGFTRDSLPPGSVITVDGYQALDGSKRANGTALTWEDGRHLFIGSSGIGAPYEKLAPANEQKK